MIKQKTIDYLVCDLCESGSPCYDRCRGCSKHLCIDCLNSTKTIKYSSKVSHKGEKAGTYCVDCDQTAKGEVINAYRKIKELRTIRDHFDGWFEGSAEEAENNLREALLKHKTPSKP